MRFNVLAKALFDIGKEPSRIKMTELMAAVFSQATPEEARVVSYLALGILRAPYQGNQFNFAEKSILKVLATVRGEGLDDFSKRVKQVGDLGVVLIDGSWPYQGKDLTVLDVYQRLEQLQSLSGTGSQEEKALALRELLADVDELSASYIVRIILGTMRLGFSDMTLIDALSWMAVGNKSLKKDLEAAYNLSADIGYIAYLFKSEGIEGVRAVRPTIGVPIRLAAAERAESPRAIIEKIGPCDAQPKLDGFRLQIHIDKKNNRIWFFSRNLLNMSSMFPDLHEALLKVDADSLIVEGEAIVYDEETQSFLPFQETVKRKRKHGIEEVAQTLPLRLFLFDILYANGESVLAQTQRERRVLLENYFGTYPDERIHVIENKFCETVAELTEYFNEQITRGLEGLVVKRPDSIYQPGKRNFNWIKLKRHEEGHLRDTVDAVILGYYAGKGKRASFGIGAFLVGVYNQEKDCFETIAKVGTGLKDDEWKELKTLCDKQVIAEQPSNVRCASELVPDVWVYPSQVVVILADEITRSSMHTAGRSEDQLGFALRFPRFIGYALDKLPTQATSVAELSRLYKLQYGTQ